MQNNQATFHPTPLSSRIYVGVSYLHCFLIQNAQAQTWHGKSICYLSKQITFACYTLNCFIATAEIITGITTLFFLSVANLLLPSLSTQIKTARFNSCAYSFNAFSILIMQQDFLRKNFLPNFRFESYLIAHISFDVSIYFSSLLFQNENPHFIDEYEGEEQQALVIENQKTQFENLIFDLSNVLIKDFPYLIQKEPLQKRPILELKQQMLRCIIDNQNILNPNYIQTVVSIIFSVLYKKNLPGFDYQITLQQKITESIKEIFENDNLVCQLGNTADEGRIAIQNLDSQIFISISNYVQLKEIEAEIVCPSSFENAYFNEMYNKRYDELMKAKLNFECLTVDEKNSLKNHLLNPSFENEDTKKLHIQNLFKDIGKLAVKLYRGNNVQLLQMSLQNFVKTFPQSK